jgi:acetyl-CoA carboxylase biotin carboxylase subunit
MEFLLDPSGALRFLEMNTRLQVEHPVTEMVTGVDLAQAQLRIAAGQGLPWRQEQIRWSGHAIEARVNAEDPAAGFRPAPGTVKHFRIAGEGVRVDTHVCDGARIPPLYDSLLAKVVAHGADRAQAIARLAAALAGAQVEGLPTTIPLHRRILADGEFRAGRYDTGWLERLLAKG